MEEAPFFTYMTIMVTVAFRPFHLEEAQVLHLMTIMTTQELRGTFLMEEAPVLTYMTIMTSMTTINPCSVVALPIGVRPGIGTPLLGPSIT